MSKETNIEAQAIKIQVWYFGSPFSELSDLALSVRTRQAWDSNEGEMLRMGRAEMKRRRLTAP